MTESSTNSQASGQKWTPVFGLILIAGAATVVSFHFQGKFNSDEALGFVAHYIALALILMVVFKRSEWGKRLGAIFLMGLVYAGAASFEMAGKGFISRDRLSYKQTVLFLDTIQGMQLEYQVGLEISDAGFDKFPGNIQRLMRLLQNSMNALRKTQLDYVEYAGSEELVMVLSPPSLTNPTAQGAFAVKAAMEQLSNYRSALENYYTELPEKIDMLNLSKPMTEGLMSGFENNRKNLYPLLQAAVDTQQELLDTILEVHTLATSSSIAFDPKSGMLYMEDDSTIEQYNALMDRLAKLGDDEARLESEVQQWVQKGLDKMKQARKDIGL